MQNMDDVITVSDPLQAAYDKGFEVSFTVVYHDTAVSPFIVPEM